MLTDFAYSNGYTNLRFYADDGYSGTNFDRPNFKRMITDCENGLVDTIIVKDMSRFGRNYILMGQFLDVLLPMYGVRVIGVTDHFDSSESENDFFALESIFAELYAAQISRKVANYKRNKGMHGGVVKTRPIYGYKVLEHDKDKWLIDEKVAGIVYLIFDKFVNEEWTEYGIAKYLSVNQVPTTSAYIHHALSKPRDVYRWTYGMVCRLLSMQEYCGDTVALKSRRISFKTKETEFLPKEEWQIFKDTHEPIVSREMFEKAQVRLARERVPFSERKYEYDTYFRRKLRCSECGKKMFLYLAKGTEGQGFNCKEFIIYKTCKSHHVRENTLRSMLRDQLEILQTALRENPEKIEHQLGIYGIDELESNLQSKEQAIAEIEDKMKSLFESKMRGEISPEDFVVQSQDHNTQKTAIQEECNLINERLAKAKQTGAPTRELLTYIKEQDFSTILEEHCDLLVEEVVVGEFAKQGRSNYGKQALDIYLYHIGKIGDLVDVRYKTYREQVQNVMLDLQQGGKFTVKDVCNRLEIGYEALKKCLYAEGTSYKKIKAECREKGGFEG